MAELRFERWYPHPAERVWLALTDRELLARWLMPNDFEPRIGHRFTFRTQPGPGFDGIVHCQVLELVEQRQLSISWKGGPIDTIVRFELSPEAGGTRLRMRQSGFRGLKAWLVSRILKAGLRTIYGKRLPAVLDSLRQPAEPLPAGAAVCMTPSQGVIRRLLAWLGGGTR